MIMTAQSMEFSGLASAGDVKSLKRNLPPKWPRRPALPSMANRVVGILVPEDLDAPVEKLLRFLLRGRWFNPQAGLFASGQVTL
jgi:hypothetical protein